MLSISAGWVLHEFVFGTKLNAQGGSHISTRREDSASSNVVLLTLGDHLEIELSDFEAVNVMLKGDCVWKIG